jgi:hypothetical protein
MVDPHLHLYVENLHRELREIALVKPRLDRPNDRGRSGLSRRLRSLAYSPAQVARRDGTPVPAVTIRPAREADRRNLTRLAELSERRLPSGLVLVAEVDAGIVAAVPAGGGPLLSDLMRPTADVAQLLELRSDQLRASARKQAA